MSSSHNETKPVRIGIIGCGEIAQVVHIPTLLFMQKWYTITYLCDVSRDALKHCNEKLFGSAKTTINPEELCASELCDAVLIGNSDEYHAAHALLALKHDKHVFVEKPCALTKRDINALIETEKKSKGKLMVGQMRRYAAPFEDAVKEVGGVDKILYARVRGIIGPNPHFVSQSGTFPQKFTDFPPESIADKDARGQELMTTALEECGVGPLTPEKALMWRVFGGLGSHDLGVMRDVLGMPNSVVGSHLGFPFWNVLFRYPNFTVSYESGIDNVPRFDSHVELYTANKTVRLQYDTPYVKGLPVSMHVVENADGICKESKVIKSYEDPYTLELKVFYDMVISGTPAKTSAADSLQDLEVFGMAMKHFFGRASANL